MRRTLLIKLAKILPILPLVVAIAKLVVKASAAPSGGSFVQPLEIIDDEWDVGF